MELLPEERLFAALIRLSIHDALHHERERVRIEAQRWLWWIAPGIAQRANVPTPPAQTTPQPENSYV